MKLGRRTDRSVGLYIPLLVFVFQKRLKNVKQNIIHNLKVWLIVSSLNNFNMVHVFLFTVPDFSAFSTNTVILKPSRINNLIITLLHVTFHIYNLCGRVDFSRR